jgi:hypothetical protein
VNVAAEDLPDDVGALKAMVIAERARADRFEHLLDVLKRNVVRQTLRENECGSAGASA